MFFEALQQLLELNLGWFVDLVLLNPHYLFAFFAAIYFFYEGKDVLLGFLFFVFVLYIVSSLNMVFGWVLFVGGFLSVYYISKVVVLIFTENSPVLSRYSVLISTTQAYVVWVVYNLYLV